MKKWFIAILALFSWLHCSSQNWSEPVTISTTAYIDNPNFTIDKNGVIHCVWAGGDQVDYRKIYYSKSEDNGLTWEAARDISLNTNLELSDPHIVADTDGNLYVTYVYNVMNPDGTMIYYLKFNGTFWSSPELLSTGLPGAREDKLTIDRNNRVYCFWYNGNSTYGTIFYRYLENGIWSGIIRPYKNDDEKLILGNAVSDSNSLLHCIGSYYKFNVIPSTIIYFTCSGYNYSNYEEIDPDTDNTDSGGGYLCLNKNGNPAAVWGRDYNDSIPLVIGTLFSEFNEVDWSPSEIINQNYPENQSIAADDNNTIHIIEQEDYNEQTKIVHYTHNGTGWIRDIVQQSDTVIGFGNPSMIIQGAYLYLMYVKGESSKLRSHYNQVVFQKLELPIGISEKNQEKIIVFPNPTESIINIYIPSAQTGGKRIEIYNYSGKMIFTRDFNNNKIELNIQSYSQGCYFIKIISGKKVCWGKFCKI